MRSDRNTPPVECRGFTDKRNEPRELTRYIVLPKRVDSHCKSLQKAVDEALRRARGHPEDSYLVIGSKHGILGCDVYTYKDTFSPGRPIGGPTRERMIDSAVLVCESTWRTRLWYDCTDAAL